MSCTDIYTDNSGKDDSGSSGVSCFATSVTAGSPLAKGLPLLRRFRDEYLKSYPVGRWAIHAYYRYSPILSNYVNSKPAMKVASRITIAGIMTHLRNHFTESDISGNK